MPDRMRQRIYLELVIETSAHLSLQRVTEGLRRTMTVIDCQVHDSLAALVAQVTERLGGESCDCEVPGYFFSGIPGVIARVPNGTPPLPEAIERCDHCQRFPSDDAAIDAVLRHFADDRLFPRAFGGEAHAP